MSQSDVSPQPSPSRPPPLPYAVPGSFQPPSYDSARPRAQRVIFTIWILALLDVLLVWPYIGSIQDLRLVVAGGELSEELAARDIVMMIVGALHVIVFIVAAVFWMMWVHRAHRNLPALGAQELRFSPGWAVGYYFIPFINLVRPYQVMSESWRASDPRHRGGIEWKTLGGAGLVGLWWTMWLLSNVVGQISFRINMRSEDPEALLRIAWVDLFILPFDIALALVAIRMIKRITQMQEERAALPAS